MNTSQKPNSSRPAFAAVAMDGSNNYVSFGLTKREYIATHILQGLCTNPEFKDLDDIVDASIEATDRLLEKLEI